jgi:hypothetical protein
LKLTPAPRTDPGIDLERLLPIPLLSLLAVAPGFSNYPVQFFLV